MTGELKLVFAAMFSIILHSCKDSTSYSSILSEGRADKLCFEEKKRFCKIIEEFKFPLHIVELKRTDRKFVSYTL